MLLQHCCWCGRGLNIERPGVFTMTPTAHAAANETEVAAAVTTAKASSASMRSVVRQSTAIADATIAADDTATETPIRASMYDAGNVTAAAAAADTIDSVTVVPVIS